MRYALLPHTKNVWVVLVVFCFFGFEKSVAQENNGNENWSTGFSSDVSFHRNVNALISWNGKLLAGGSIIDLFNPEIKNIVQWDGNGWSAAGTDACESCIVEHFAQYADTLLAFGIIKLAAEDPYRLMLQFKDGQWQSFSPELDGNTVFATSSDDTRLYVAGIGLKYGEEELGNLAVLHEGAWISIPGDFGQIRDLTTWNDGVIISGSFTIPGSDKTRGLAIWDGNEWSVLEEVDVNVDHAGGSNPSLEVLDGKLYVYGNFHLDSIEEMVSLASWDGNEWTPIAYDILEDPFEPPMVAHEGNIYVGTRARVYSAEEEEGTLYTLAKWDGEQFEYITGETSRMHANVKSLATHEGELVIGTTMYEYEGVGVTIDAYSEEKGWRSLHAFNGGTNAPILDMALYDKGVLATGFFNQAGNSSAAGIAYWNGSSWEAFNGGLNGWGRVLAVDGNEVYVGGHGRYPDFTKAGNLETGSIAHWDGTQWIDLGEGLDGSVLAIAVEEEMVYVGGRLTEIGGEQHFGVARWNGQAWSVVGAGFPDIQVEEIAVMGDSVVVVADRSNTVGLFDGNDWEFFDQLGGNSEIQEWGFRLFEDQGSLFVGYRNLSEGVWNFGSWKGPGSWMPFTEPVGGFRLNDFVVVGERLVAVGNPQLTESGQTVTSAGILFWDGLDWRELGSGTMLEVPGLNLEFATFLPEAVEVSDGKMLIGGSHWSTGGQSSRYFGVWTDPILTSSAPGQPFKNPAAAIYPNPSAGIAFLQLDEFSTGSLRVDLFNILGQRIWGEQRTLAPANTTIPIDLSSFARGSYFVRIQIEDHSQVIPIIHNP